MSTARLGYRGVRLEVEAEAEHLDWLVDFLGPEFAVSPEHAESWRLHFEVSPARFAALLDAMRRADSTIVAFALDRDDVELPAVAEAAGPVAVDRRFAVAWRVDLARRTVALWADGDGRRARLGLMRVVREIVREECSAAGDLFLHSAAVAVEGGVVALAGPKGAGKTTLLARALAAGADYVANDRLCVWRDAGLAQALGLPTIVSLRQDAVTRLPRLARRPQPVSACWERPAEARGASGSQLANLTPSAFCAAFSAQRVAGGRLRAIVFPCRDGREHALPWRALEPAAARARLATAALRSGAATAFRRSLPVAAPAIEEVLAGVPCFEAGLGSGPFAPFPLDLPASAGFHSGEPAPQS